MMAAKKVRMVRVAMIKAESAWGNVRANIRMLEDLARPLAAGKLDVLVTPECFLDGYMVRDAARCTRRKLAMRCVSGPADPVIKRAARLARELSCNMVVGASEKDSDGVVRNAAYLIDRRGRHLGTYYKTFPDKFYTPGTELPVFETDFARVGIVICADRRWPENIRTLRLKGAEIILNPTWGWFGGGNTAIVQTRAYENGLPVCFAHPSQALICMPDSGIGAILESNVPTVLVHDVNLADNPRPSVTDNKASSHPVQNRRPELWGEIAAR